MIKIMTCIGALLPSLAHAHVKWFSNYDFQQPPLELSQIATPGFWALFALSLVSLPLLVFTDKASERSAAYLRVEAFLDRYAGSGTLIMRVAMGAVLLMSWQNDAYIAPELAIPSPLWGWFQFALALLLLFRETTPLTGLGMLYLYGKGIAAHGVFHMLDYVVYPAVGLFLILSSLKHERLRNLELPVLYAGLGFSLCWVAFEKMVYPYWGLSVLAQAPGLTMGLSQEFFLLACAFVEFTLGYLLIICLLHRPLAVVVTLVFFITTSFFGKTEVVGHTILHGALLVFIVRGPGQYYQAPIRFHRSPAMRSAFAMVNFVLLFVVLVFPYVGMAKRAHATSMAERAAQAHPTYEVPAGVPAPSLMVHAAQDSHGGWNVHLMTENFRFTPERAGGADVPGEGHAHLYVNGRKIARIYGNWFHVNLPKGESRLRVTLNTNGHKDYAVGGRVVADETVLSEERDTGLPHLH